MRRFRSWLCSWLVGAAGGLLLAAGPAQASGYFVPEMDAEAMAQGSAWVARSRGASAIFFNPAGLTQLKGFSFSGGTTVIDLQANTKDIRLGPGGALRIGTDTDTDNSLVTPSHLFLATKLGEKVAVGVGVHTSFGLIMEWPQGWPSNQNFGSYVVEKVDLKTFVINPSVAYAVTENLSIGAGFDWVLSMAVLENQSDISALGRALGLPGLPPLQLELDADNGSGDFGFNAGVLFQQGKFSAGVSYRSQITLDLEGDADFTTPTTGVPPLDQALLGLFPDQTGGTTIPLPDLVMAGVAFRPTDKLELEVDVNWANWADFDEFTIDFETNTSVPGPGGTPIPVLTDRVSEQNWENGFTLRAGGSFDVSEAVELRLGGIYDPTVIPDENLRPLLPESDRFGLAAGLGLQFGKVDVDLAYLYIGIPERTVDPAETTHEDNFYATYSGRGHLFGLTLSFGD